MDMPAWPPVVAERNPRVRYAWLPPLRSRCSCGAAVVNLTAMTLVTEPTPDFTVRFQHGENREAIIETDGFLSLDLEARLAQWTADVHRYERERVSRS